MTFQSDLTSSPSAALEHAGMAHAIRRGVALIASGIILSIHPILSAPASADPDQPFRDFYGTWSGTGSAVFSDGKRERLRCTAYYTGADSLLKLAIRCASPSNKIEMRADVSASGSAIKGHWEERTYNAEGDGNGRIIDNKLNMKISGTVEGELVVTTDKTEQLVSVNTTGTALQGVHLKLKRRSSS